MSSDLQHHLLDVGSQELAIVPPGASDMSRSRIARTRRSDSTRSASPDDDESLEAPIEPLLLASDSPARSTSEYQARLLHNAFLPVHALPNEILLEPLHLAINFERSHLLVFPQLHALARVCTRWRDIVFSSRRFWCFLSGREDALARTVLKRNPHGPLIVQMERLSGQDVREFFKLACEHAHRWETVFLDLNPKQAKQLTFHAPRLKSLQVFSFTVYHPIIIPLLSVPSLVHLRLVSARLPWNSLSLSGLKYLYLQSLRGFLSPTQFISILRAAPNLEWLGLTHVKEDSHAIIPTTLSSSVSLLSLRGVDMTILNEVVPFYLKCGINAPNCRILRFTITFQEVLDNLTEFKSLVVPMVQADDIAITVEDFAQNDDNVQLTIASVSPTLKAYMEDWPTYGVNDSAVNITVKDFPATHWSIFVQELGLCVEKSGITTYFDSCDPKPKSRGRPQSIDAYRRCFAPWDDTISRIIFRLDTDDIIPALYLLSRPSYGQDGTASWPCRRLHTIEISQLYQYEEDIFFELCDYFKNHFSKYGRQAPKVIFWMGKSDFARFSSGVAEGILCMPVD